VEERGRHDENVSLLGVVVCPPCNALLVRSHASGVSARIERRVPTGEGLMLRQLLRQTLELSDEPFREGARLLSLLFDRVEHSSNGAQGVHVVFSSEGALQNPLVRNLLLRRPHLRASAKSCLSVWVDVTELWIEQSRDSEQESGAIAALEAAIEGHLRRQGAVCAPFVWLCPAASPRTLAVHRALPAALCPQDA
jgi:hypothetical protein